MAPTNSMRPGDEVGFWGPPSSTINWCETNYEVNYYIAEFWNTITNLGMIIPPIYGLLNCRKLGIEARYTFSFIMNLLVGIGSWMFHMTLTFEMQLLDEIPMMWCGSYIVYCLYSSRCSSRSSNQAKIVPIILSIILVTCHGYSFLLASLPPIILLSTSPLLNGVNNVLNFKKWKKKKYEK